MSEHPRPTGTADLPHHLLDTGAPVALTRTTIGVTATVTGPSGTALLTVTLQTEPLAENGTRAVLVVADGVVDTFTAPLLEAALNDAVDRHTTVRCDLSAVRILSAAGITALLSAHQRAARTGSGLTVRGAQGLTQRVLQITKVDHLLCHP